MTYVFRNNTIEQFLGIGYQFSSYDDVSVILSADAYLWWYQVPLHFNYHHLVEEVRSYNQKLRFLAEQIQKPFYVFTLARHFFSQVETSNGELATAIDEFNALVRHLSETKANVKIVDFSEFANAYGINELIDWRYYYTAQIPYNPQLIRSFQIWWQRKLREINLSRKKCLVLDLDNTLWGGVLGEKGLSNICLSGDYPGKAFHYWQEGLKELQRQGVMLAICSKNNFEDVEEVWAKRPDMVLKKEDFVAYRINWNDKATNLQELANELNIGLDAFVFVDDNPTERELIKQTLPMVAVPEFPNQPYGLPSLFQDIVQKYFSTYIVTFEDREKTNQYASNVKRSQAQATFVNYEDFLRSLEMKLTIEPINDISIVRAAQMTQKTNQFNLTTRRYMESDIRKMLLDGGKGWTLSVEDKFGDNGITGLLIMSADGVFDTMLMSCRILGKGIEKAFINYVLQQVKEDGLNNVVGLYIPTAKNGQVQDFWSNMGFSLIKTEDDGMCSYALDLNTAELEIENYYKIN